MTRRKLRAAVVGAGAMGLNHARVYSELDSVELVAIADIDGAAAERACRRYPATAFWDGRSALESSAPDIVSIAVPTRLHEAVALDAVELGCHVLVEKPLRAELESLVAAVLDDRDPAVTGDDGLAAIDIGLTLAEAGRRHVPMAPRLSRRLTRESS